MKTLNRSKIFMKMLGDDEAKIMGGGRKEKSTRVCGIMVQGKDS